MLEGKGFKARLRRSLLVICLLVSGGAVAEPLNIYVGQGQMPFADYGQARQGMVGDLMQALCERMQAECRFRAVPWKRVQHEVEGDPHGIVLNLGRVPEREADFVWLLQVLRTRYVLSSLDQRYDTLEQALAAGPVVVMAGTPRGAELRAARTGDQRVVEMTDPALAAQMLMCGRVAAWYEIGSRSLFLWRELGFAQTALLTGAPLNQVDSYIAGSPRLEHPEAWRTRMQRAFEGMLADGSWRAILLRYVDEAKASELIAGLPGRDGG